MSTEYDGTPHEHAMLIIEHYLKHYEDIQENVVRAILGTDRVKPKVMAKWISLAPNQMTKIKQENTDGDWHI